MNYFLLLLKTVFAPVWIPLWLMKKCWRLFAVLLLGAVVAGCASNSAKLNMSPCAGCDFHPINNTFYVSERYA